MYEVTENFTVNDINNRWSNKISEALKYLTTGRGLLGMGAAFTGGYVKVLSKHGDP